MAAPPERSKRWIDVSSLRKAYQEMQKRDLAVVPSDSCLTSHAVEWCQMKVPLGEKETTWDLVKVAKKRMSSCMKDGINDDRISLEGPISMIHEVSTTPSQVPNSTKTKRRKKMTAAKFVQLQDPRLFHVGQKEKKRRKKRTSRKRGVNAEQKTTVEPKRGKQKYFHLQKFIVTRRQKKLEKKCTLDLSAQVTWHIDFFGDHDGENVDDDDDDYDDDKKG